MRITEEEQLWHEQYENAPDTTREAIDQAWRAVREVFDKHSLKSATDDRADALIVALYRYYVVSTLIACGTPRAAEGAAELVKNLNELFLLPAAPKRLKEPEVECGAPWVVAEHLKREGKV